ncbi:MAG: ATP synthase F1 subunit gamma [Rickettsiales bacterium]|nr:ATP synthase F1 subunit gamma [Rickettsiales bacterium]|tara:strand:+ start:1918 stop:2772 length:855 start_codon:yes stop_codon:yes gene_type:complete
MASGKDLKNRIKSITSIKKITKAMKMVAASKLRQVQNALEAVRPISGLTTSVVSEIQNTLLNMETENQSKESIKKLVIVISSDRGLCGGINSSVVKDTRLNIKSSQKNNELIELYTIGDKAKDVLVRSHAHHMNTAISETAKRKLSFAIASIISEDILKSQFDVCEIVYNQFKSVISQNLVRSQLYSRNNLNKAFFDWNTYEFDSEKSSVLYDLYEYNLAIAIYNAMLENATSEQGARMNAMDSASRNASEMIDKLTLTYNKARQAAITSELIEIISCASAVAK